MITPEIATHVTWECIHLGTSLEGRAELERCKQKGLCGKASNMRGIKTEAALLSRISEALSFPSYFGTNWDALSDCLRDLSWLNPKGVLLLLEDSKDLWPQHNLSGALIEIWLFCAEAWARRDVPFHLAFTWD